VIAVGIVGVYRYVENYWRYRGFAPPHDAAFVKTPGATERFYLPSRALAGRRQPVDVYLPPGYRSHLDRRYPVMYLLHGSGRPDAFLATVRLGVEDELVALHRAGPMIPRDAFGSTGSFTDRSERTASAATTTGRRSSRVISSTPSTTGIARFPAVRREFLPAFRRGYGAINIGIHHPGEFATIESWSGYMVADDLGAIFGHRPTADAQSRSTRSRLPRRRCDAPTPMSGSTSEATTRCAGRTPRSPVSSTPTGSRTDSSSCAAGTTGLSGGATRRRPISPLPGGSMVRRLALLPLVVVPQLHGGSVQCAPI
jgi:hypothetical protein